MPTNVVKTQRQERLWNEAKARAAEAGEGGNYAYIMGIYQRMIKQSASKNSSGSKQA